MPVDQTAPAEIDFTARQGSPFHAYLQFFTDTGGTVPMDLTGYRVDMHIREGVADSAAPVVLSLSTEADSDNDARIFYVAEASSGEPDPDGTPDPSNGFIYLKLASAETVLLQTAKQPKQRSYPAVGKFYYDIEATPPGGEPFALAFGKFDVTLEITRRT
jgi:hypothetical protein